jgi:hypothetical protein
MARREPFAAANSTVALLSTPIQRRPAVREIDCLLQIHLVQRIDQTIQFVLHHA